jgi:hypothetical protein
VLLVLALIAAAPDPLASMVQTRDEVQGVTWLRDRAQLRSHAPDTVSCSFARFSSGYGPLRLTIVHTGKRLLYPETATFLVDGSSFVLPEIRRGLRGCSWRSGTNRSGAIETCDVQISSEHPDLLAALLAAKSVKVRLQGDRAHEFTVPKTQLDAIRRVHAAWRAASQRPAH